MFLMKFDNSAGGRTSSLTPVLDNFMTEGKTKVEKIAKCLPYARHLPGFGGNAAEFCSPSLLSFHLLCPSKFATTNKKCREIGKKLKLDHLNEMRKNCDAVLEMPDSECQTKKGKNRKSNQADEAIPADK
jgi:hypothetical protein